MFLNFFVAYAFLIPALSILILLDEWSRGLLHQLTIGVGCLVWLSLRLFVLQDSSSLVLNLALGIYGIDFLCLAFQNGLRMLRDQIIFDRDWRDFFEDFTYEYPHAFFWLNRLADSYKKKKSVWQSLRELYV